MPTTSTQVRTAVTVDDVAKFKVVATITDQGDLPSIVLFVREIVDPFDSKEDRFLRVTTIADLSELTIDRATAVANSAEAYRTAVITLYYTDVETANNAQKVLKERIDELVADYEIFLTQFETVSELTTHPQLGEDTFNAAVTAFTTARTATDNAEVTRDAAEATYNTAVTTASETAAECTAAFTRLTNCNNTKQYYDTMLAAFSLLKTTSDTYSGVVAVGAFTTNSQTFQAAARVYRDATPLKGGSNESNYDAAEGIYLSNITAFTNQTSTYKQDLVTAAAALAAATTNQAAVAATCSALQAEYDSCIVAKNDADTAVADARTAFSDAQAAVISAQQQENAALAAVQNLKPDFDPDTV